LTWKKKKTVEKEGGERTSGNIQILEESRKDGFPRGIDSHSP